MFGKRTRKSRGSMKTLSVKLPGGRGMKAKAKTPSKKHDLSFTEWVDQYVKASHGNPV